MMSEILEGIEMYKNVDRMKSLAPLSKQDVNWIMYKTFKPRKCWSAGINLKPHGKGEFQVNQNEAKGKPSMLNKEGKVKDEIT
jgi:hypothetical protein